MLPTMNSPIAVTSNAVLVPAAGALASAKGGGNPRLVAWC
jgi:hypothetical protein